MQVKRPHFSLHTISTTVTQRTPLARRRCSGRSRRRCRVWSRCRRPSRRTWWTSTCRPPLQRLAQAPARPPARAEGARRVCARFDMRTWWMSALSPASAKAGAGSSGVLLRMLSVPGGSARGLTAHVGGFEAVALASCGWSHARKFAWKAPGKRGLPRGVLSEPMVAGTACRGLAPDGSWSQANAACMRGLSWPAATCSRACCRCYASWERLRFSA